jgi:hypothetical protein
MIFGIDKILAACAVFLGTAPALAEPMDLPAMSGALAKNPEPIGDTGPWGTLLIGGAISGMGSWQNHPAARERDAIADLSNGEIFGEMKSAWLELFVRAGYYALPALGTPTLSAQHAAAATYGLVPEALAKVTLDKTLSIEAGKLPTLIGNEYAFTFQNMNIERGLLWNQTPSVNRGIQANYAAGLATLSLSWNDGYYSNRFNWVTGLASYSWNDAANSLSFFGGANLGRSGTSSFATPIAQNNSAIAGLIYTHVSGRWTVSPYLQLSRVPARPSVGLRGAGTFGAAFLGSYAVSEAWAVAGRAELLMTGGEANVLYGPDSGAWSLTLTPSYQQGRFFARGELSYVGLDHAKAGFSLGRTLAQTSQARLLTEAGYLF